MSGLAAALGLHPSPHLLTYSHAQVSIGRILQYALCGVCSHTTVILYSASSSLIRTCRRRRFRHHSIFFFDAIHVSSYDLSLYAIYLVSSYYCIAHTHLLVLVWILYSALAVPRGQQHALPLSLYLYTCYICVIILPLYVSSCCSAQAVPRGQQHALPLSYHSTYICYICVLILPLQLAPTFLLSLVTCVFIL
jgi:hypothetical protein